MKVIDRAVQKEKLAAVLYSDDPRADFMKQLAGLEFTDRTLNIYRHHMQKVYDAGGKPDLAGMGQHFINENVPEFAAGIASIEPRNGKQYMINEAENSKIAGIAVADPLKWKKPEPIIQAEKSEEYPIDALPGLIGNAVHEVLEITQCPPAIAANSALSVVSCACQGLVDVRRAHGLEGPTSLYLLCLADSGERKSTIDGYFSTSIDQWEKEQAAALKPEIKKYNADLQIWEAKKAGLLAKLKDASKAGRDTTDLENKIVFLEQAKPEPPKNKRLKYVDATQEELAYRLAHCWPTAGILSAEGGSVFGGYSMGKDSMMRLMALLNSQWSGEPYRVDRRTTPSYTLRNSRLTIGIAAQPETVRAFVEATNGLARGIGWLARFLIAWPETTQGKRKFKEPPEEWPSLSRFNRRMADLLDIPLSFSEEGTLTPTLLDLDPEAKRAWIAFHDEIEAELAPGREMEETRDVASKTADNAARLAALFHVFENGPTGTIGIDSLIAGARVAAWHLYEARRFMREIAMPETASIAMRLDAWLVSWVRQHGEMEISTVDIQRYGPSCLRKKATLDPALMELVDTARIRITEKGRKRIVEVNPYLIEETQ